MSKTCELNSKNGVLLWLFYVLLKDVTIQRVYKVNLLKSTNSKNRYPRCSHSTYVWGLPCFMAWQAKWRATRDEEQAQSMATEGPVKLNMYEMRLAAMLIASPVPVVWLICFGLILTVASSKSLFINPGNQTNKSLAQLFYPRSWRAQHHTL